MFINVWSNKSLKVGDSEFLLFKTKTKQIGKDELIGFVYK